MIIQIAQCNCKVLIICTSRRLNVEGYLVKEKDSVLKIRDGNSISTQGVHFLWMHILYLFTKQ
jgi:hypothetical protein